VNAHIESYLQGVSTRNVENIISPLGVNQISASYVSKVARELDVKVTEFMEKEPSTCTFRISTSMHRTSK
jgi:transposase-like protein